MEPRRRLLFLQLPQLDNDVRGAHENIHLAAVCLRHSLERSGEARSYEIEDLAGPAEDVDDFHIEQEIVSRKPDVVAATLYLWNIERSLALLERVKERLPNVRIVVGGPEVAPDHPFLFRRAVADAAVTGEGEPVFPAVLRSLFSVESPDLRTVAWGGHGRLAWGHRPPPSLSLEESLPPASSRLLKPDASGMVYLEASRGCPLLCTYCRYHHSRPRLSFLAPKQVLARVQLLADADAREIRFVDPTFNSHPAFDEIIRLLACFNKSRRLRFFAEMRGETLTREQARLLAAAGFTEIEIGVQAIQPQILRRIRRPADIPALENGIRALLANRIRVTIDIMYGLPGQTLKDVKESVRWALRFRGGRVQCLQTLLIPGTDLRRQRARWGMRALPRPPYGVLATGTLDEDDMIEAERFIHPHVAGSLDTPISRFVGVNLPDLFAERIPVNIHPAESLSASIPGSQNRRTVLFFGCDLWGSRQRIVQAIRRALAHEPHILWQFVLVPNHEEPLDLLDVMSDEIRRAPVHLNDRWASVMFAGKIASRPVMVQLARRGLCSPSWIRAAEALLEGRFH